MNNKNKLVNRKVDSDSCIGNSDSLVHIYGSITGPIQTNNDTIIGNFHLLHSGLMRILKEIPHEQGMPLRGGKNYHSWTLKIFPSVFNVKLSESDFFSIDTLNFSWKSDTIIWCNSPCNWANMGVYYDVEDAPMYDEEYKYVGPDCVMFSRSDQIKCKRIDIKGSMQWLLTHDAYTDDIVTPEIEKILSEWNQTNIDSFFIKFEDYNWIEDDGYDHKNVYGRIIIKDGKLVDLKSIVTLDATKGKQKKV